MNAREEKNRYQRELYARSEKVRITARSYAKRRYGSMRDDLLKESQSRQDATLTAANSNGKPWSPDDDEIAMRDDLTIAEIAEALGRTYRATVRRRHYLKTGI